MRRCEVYVHGIKAGILTELDNHEYVFEYDKTYLTGNENPPVCLNMPLRTEAYHAKSLFPFFFNLLSEGENRKMQAQLLHIAPEDDFGILMATAQTDTIGAVTVKPIIV